MGGHVHNRRAAGTCQVAVGGVAVGVRCTQRRRAICRGTQHPVRAKQQRPPAGVFSRTPILNHQCSHRLRHPGKKERSTDNNRKNKRVHSEVSHIDFVTQAAQEDNELHVINKHGRVNNNITTICELLQVLLPAKILTSAVGGYFVFFFLHMQQNFVFSHCLCLSTRKQRKIMNQDLSLILRCVFKRFPRTKENTHGALR